MLPAWYGMRRDFGHGNRQNMFYTPAEMVEILTNE